MYEVSASRAEKKAYLKNELEKAIEQLQRAAMLLNTGGPMPTAKQCIYEAKRVVDETHQRVFDTTF